MKKGLIILAGTIIVVALAFVYYSQKPEDKWVCDKGQWTMSGQPTENKPDGPCDDLSVIENFDDCIAAGYPAMESYPRQCAVPGGETFVEDIKDEENFQIVEVLDSSCILDSECKTPGEYLIKSNCPYESRCMDEQCVVICPSEFMSDIALDVDDTLAIDMEALDKSDMIRVTKPLVNSDIESPLLITGEARGTWFFEGDFPVALVDWDGLIIAEGYAIAQSDWVTEDFVEFATQIEFEKPELYDNGVLILQKSNPSGLPENDDSLEIPIKFK